MILSHEMSLDETFLRGGGYKEISFSLKCEQSQRD